MELIPRFHQELFVKKTIDKIKEGKNKFLWGWKCRAGKTYGVGHLIESYFNEFEMVNALIITPAPSETLTQFGTEMFHKFSNFRHLNIIEIKKGKDLNNIIYDNNNVIVISKQLLDNYVKNEKKTDFHKQLYDLIIFDENHFGGTTDNSKEILKLFDSNLSNQIFLTATYQKTLTQFKISEDCQFYWNVEDELYCKNRNINKLKIKHGIDVEYFLDENNCNDKLKFYDNMPNMNLLSTILDQERFDKIKDNLKSDDNDDGFSMDVLFSLNKDTKKFLYEKQINELLKYICGNDNKCIYKRIISYSKRKNSRTLLNNENFTTQLWFLPFGIGLKIDDLSKNLKELMLNIEEFHNYEIMIINSKIKEIKNLKNHISNNEINAKNNGKKGLILLAGNQCSLGITLPLVDIVFLMNNITSSDKIMQMMYRCMSETSDGSKKFGYVIDFNINRVLHTFIDYPIIESNLITHKKIEYMIENNLINLDDDIFESKENKGELIDKLLKIWKNDPENEQRMLFKKIQHLNIDINEKEQELMNKHFTSLGNEIDEHFVRFDDEIFQSLPKGRKKVPILNNDIDECIESVDEHNEEESKEKDISFQEDILPLIIPLFALMNHDQDNNNMKDCIEFINDSEDLKEIINDYTFMLWEKKNLFGLIYYLTNKFLVDNKEINNILYQFRMVYNSLINEPNQLLDYLKKSLKPKELEKKKFGEVFTPMEIIDEMMDNLDTNYKKMYKKSIFTEEKFKWYDPSAGMGSFPVNVYYRLMKGLEKKIPNEEKRKKHIIENMLYMTEINKKNCYILNKLFNSKKYKSNIYCGDSLKLDVSKKFEVDKFDVIMGNPPYNKGGIKAPGSKNINSKKETIWTTFVEIAFPMLKENGFLMYIHPLSWLRRTSKVHPILCEKNILWLKLMDASQSKIKIKGEIAISIYLIQNKINIDKSRTQINYEMKREDLYGTEMYYIDGIKSIPLSYYGIFEKLTKFIEKNSLELKVEARTITSSGKKIGLPKKYTLEDKYNVDTYTLKEGLLVKKSKDYHPDASKNKIIIANKTNFSGMFVDKGKLGLTGSDKFYILGDDLNKLMEFMNYKIFKVVLQFTKYRMYFLDKEAFEFIPDIRKYNKKINEEKFYELLGLTRTEINNINNM